jgi:hypothetical protein
MLERDKGEEEEEKQDQAGTLVSKVFVSFLSRLMSFPTHCWTSFGREERNCFSSIRKKINEVNKEKNEMMLSVQINCLHWPQKVVF